VEKQPEVVPPPQPPQQQQPQAEANSYGKKK
jgi:hypothetical protein